MERERPGALLARRTRTVKRCSFDARSEGQSGCSPKEPVRHCLRDEAKEVLPDARSVAGMGKPDELLLLANGGLNASAYDEMTKNL